GGSNYEKCSTECAARISCKVNRDLQGCAGLLLTDRNEPVLPAITIARIFRRALARKWRASKST
ncbi:MAG TPA: hypothetical protein VG104_01060, partial [Candidatus Dormibacteraeota bacterium]|nr:hypothetical protein [Candidatus Dormibacteraeota bacterium]